MAKTSQSLLISHKNIPQSDTVFPFKAMIEVCRLCNLRCPLCPVGTGLANQYPIMDKKIYKNIIDQISPFIAFLKLYNYGEPLLHPDIVSFVCFAKHKGIKTVEITTNGTVLKLNQEYDLIKAGIDIYRVSVDGTTQEQYSKYRVGGDLNLVLTNLKRMVFARKILKSNNPIIEMQVIVMKHNESSLNKFQNIAQEIGVDRMRYKTLNAYMAGHLRKKIAYNFLPKNRVFLRYAQTKGVKVLEKYKKNSCIWLQKVFVVNSNGDVVPCCYDFNGTFKLGTVLTGKFNDWWETKERDLFRRNFLETPSSINMCNNCAYGVPSKVIWL